VIVPMGRAHRLGNMLLDREAAARQVDDFDRRSPLCRLQFLRADSGTFQQMAGRNPVSEGLSISTCGGVS
jgi:hypothetical protein